MGHPLFGSILNAERGEPMKNTQEGLFITNLFNLKPEDIMNIHYENDDAGNSIYHIRLVPDFLPCPNCGCKHPSIKNYVLKTIKHSTLSDRNSILRYKARRYVCPICHKTYYEKNPFVFKASKISIKVVLNVLKDLKDFNETFTSVGRRHNISPTSVASIFDQHVQLTRSSLPKILSIDEVYAFKSSDSKYVCVLLDFLSQEPVDLLPQRTYDGLRSYFSSIPIEEREKVEVVCSDMYDTYRSIAKKYFPNCRCAVDTFHVAQEFHRKMNAVRIRIMKGYSKDDPKEKDNYYLLKKFNWLLFKDSEAYDRNGPLFDPNREKKYNYHFKRYMNFYDIREKIFEIDPVLLEVYNLKLDLHSFYTECTYETAQAQLEQLIQKFYTSSIEEMNKFGNTLAKWKDEIINSFIIAKYDYSVNKDDGSVTVQGRKVNNALIENRNKIIKCIKHNANGYSNWYRFRNRVLYVLRKSATYHLEPLDVPWKKKKKEED